MERRVDLAVIGGGPAGLAHAFWALREDPSREIIVLEAAPRAGGRVHSDDVDGFLLEWGPDALRPNAELEALVDALALGDEMVAAVPAASLRWIGRGGALQRVPGGPRALVASRILSWRAKLRLFREPWIRRGGRDGESIAAFVGRRFGPECVPLVHAIVSGIYAGDAERLETASAFPTLARAEAEHGSVLRGLVARRRGGGPAKARRPSLVSFRTGLGTLIDALATALGPRLRTHSPVATIEALTEGYRLTPGPDGAALIARELVCAAPANRAAALLAPLDAELGRELAEIRFAPVASVQLGLDLRDATAAMQGFGFLLEPGERSPVLGALNCSSTFPHRAPEGRALVRVMLGGVRAPEVVGRDDASLASLAIDDHRRYTGYRGHAELLGIVRSEAAIPQFESGHATRLARIEACLRRLPGLRLRGNSYRAIALPAQLGFDTSAGV